MDSNIFETLPVGLNMSRLRSRLKRKHDQLCRLEHNIKWIQASIDSDNLEQMNMVLQSSLSKILNSILRIDTIRDKARMLHGLINDEEQIWEDHIQFIRNKKLEWTKETHKNENTLHFRDTKEEKGQGPDVIKVPKRILQQLNKHMNNASCTQIFQNIAHDRDTFGFLSDDMTSWSEHLTSIIPDNLHTSFLFSSTDATRLLESIQVAKTTIASVLRKIIRAQAIYNKRKIIYLTQVNDYKAFARKIRPLGREAPAAQTEIEDATTGDMRCCINEEEQLAATQAFHGKWMSNSRAKETCFFAELIRDGRLGIRGVKLKPNRKFRNADIPKVVKGGRALPRKIRRAIVRAHGPHIAKLFTEPLQDIPLFFFPFYIDHSRNNMMNDESTIEDFFWKAINKPPGKARFNGFHLATIGRFHIDWQHTLLKIIKLIFLLRYVPDYVKDMSRHPIPKPEKPKETRPISLCHDIFCFVCDIISKITSKAIEKAGILHPGIVAYREGMGCQSLVGAELGLREDCVESGMPTCQLDEDEEKYFDRASPVITLAAMRVNGFPEQGWLELKASCFGEKLVEIITNIGIVYSLFTCGLEQGNPDSPKSSNLIIKFKHDIWDCILEDCFKKNKGEKYAYYFHSIDPVDGKLKLYRIGYCDDNSRFISHINEDELLAAVQQFIKQSGDLSIVIKIGRKGSKSDVSFFNLSPSTIAHLPELRTIAWSYVQDAPTEETMPIRCYTNPNTHLNDINSLTTTELERFRSLTDVEPNKHLGLTATMSGDTSPGSTKILSKVMKRAEEIKLKNMVSEPQKYSINALIVTMISFAPLQFNHNTSSLAKCDTFIATQIGTSRGIGRNDSKHNLYLPENKLGHGIKSMLDVDLLANARELEVVMNGTQIDSRVGRTRLASLLHEGPISSRTHNHIRDAIHKLARYGIHFHDRSTGLTSYFLFRICKLHHMYSIGDSRFNSGSSHLLGQGCKRQELFSFGNSFFRKAQQMILSQSHNLPFEDKLDVETKYDLAQWLHWSLTQRRLDCIGFYWFQEWMTTPYQNSIPSEEHKWTHNYAFLRVPISTFSTPTVMTMGTCWNLIKQTITLLFHNQPTLDTNLHQQFISNYAKSLIINSKSPIFFSTDGGHMTENNVARTSAAIIMCILDIRAGETITSREWESRPMIPILARRMFLPDIIGTSYPDIGYGETAAYCMQEECIDPSIPRCVIMDSTSVRKRALDFRDNTHFSDRKRIRKVMNGLGKSITSRMEECFKRWERHRHKDKNDPFHSELHKRLQSFCEISQTWTTLVQTIQGSKTWNKKYWDKHDSRCIIKVDSHQLNDDGTAQNNQQRYTNIVPNLAITNANHHADRVATMALHPSSQTTTTLTSEQPYEMIFPFSNLRFFLTWNGRLIDKRPTSFLQKQIHNERWKRWKMKSTQGLLPRLQEHAHCKPQDINGSLGWKRALLGKSNTHTRSMYLNTPTRVGWSIATKTLKDKRSARAITDSVLTKLPKKKYLNDLLLCKWCDIQATRSPIDKIKLQDTLKGNTRHAHLHCQHNRITTVRDGISKDIEDQLWIFVDRLDSVIDPEKFIFEVNTQLLLLRQRNLGCLDTTIRQHNYLNLDEWLNFLHIDSVREGRRRRVNILSHIWGFQSALCDGELADKNSCIVDNMYTGLLPKTFDKWIINRYTLLVKKDVTIGFQHNLQQQLDSSWNIIKELVRARFIGIHRVINNISKTFATDFRKQHNLTSTHIKQLKHDLQHSKKASIPNKPKRIMQRTDPISKKNIKLSTLELWTNPLLCQGFTCENKHPLLTTNIHLPSNWIAITQKHCQRCSRFNTAIQKCLALMKTLSTSKRKCTHTRHLLRVWGHDRLLTPSQLEGMVFPHFYFLLQQSRHWDRHIDLHTLKNTVFPNDKATLSIFGSILGIVQGEQDSNQKENCIVYIQNLMRMKHNDTDAHHCFHCTCTHCENPYNTIKAPYKLHGLTLGYTICLECHARLACSWGEQTIRSILANTNTNSRLHGTRTTSKTPTTAKSTGASRIMRHLGMQSCKNPPLETMLTMIKSHGQPISGITMELLIRRLQRRFHQFISDIDIVDILLHSENFQWKRISTKFNTRLAENKRSGIYTFPILLGSYLRCKWTLIIVQKKGKNYKGTVLQNKTHGMDPSLLKITNNLSKYFTTRENFEWDFKLLSEDNMAESGYWVIASLCAIGLWNHHQIRKNTSWIDVDIIREIRSSCVNEYTHHRNLTASILENTHRCWITLKSTFNSSSAITPSVSHRKRKRLRTPKHHTKNIPNKKRLLNK